MSSKRISPNDMKTRKFLEIKTEGVADATEEEAKEFYESNPQNFEQQESVAAAHILIKTDGATNDVQKAELKAELEQIRAQILAGEITFEDAAKTHSGCPSGSGRRFARHLRQRTDGSGI